MKRSWKIGLTAGLSLLVLLQGCSQQKAEEPVKSTRQSQSSVSSSSSESQSKASSSSAASSTSQEKPVKSDQELYQKVFEDYRLLRTAPGSDPQTAESLRSQLQVPLEYWTVDNIINQADSLAYTFYDLNADGQKELLVGAKFGDNPYYLVALYYLKGEAPTLLGETHVASAGGSRSLIGLYRDGQIFSSHWQSGNGDGQATLYKLAGPNQEAQVVQQIDFTKTADGGEAQLGLSQADRLDLNSLTWEKF